QSHLNALGHLATQIASRSSPLADVGSFALWAAANDVCRKSLKINTDYFRSAPHNKNSVSSRGWRSAPRDLTPAQALARSNRPVLRFRRDGPLCDLIAAGGPSVAAATSWMTRIPSC